MTLEEVEPIWMYHAQVGGHIPENHTPTSQFLLRNKGHYNQLDSEIPPYQESLPGFP